MVLRLDNGKISTSAGESGLLTKTQQQTVIKVIFYFQVSVYQEQYKELGYMRDLKFTLDRILMARSFTWEQTRFQKQQPSQRRRRFGTGIRHRLRMEVGLQLGPPAHLSQTMSGWSWLTRALSKRLETPFLYLCTDLSHPFMCKHFQVTKNRNALTEEVEFNIIPVQVKDIH